MEIRINNHVFKWARESLNLSIEDVAQRVNKNVDTVLAWEEGRNFPTYAQLEKLAYEVFKRPLAVFFFSEPPQVESIKNSFRILPDAEILKLSPNIIKIIRQAQATQIKLKELCNGVNPFGSNIISELNKVSGSGIEMNKILRERLGVPLSKQIDWKTTEEALQQWRDALENNGVFVFKEAFKDDNISGFCLYDNEFPIIFVNNSMAKTRQIFTLFHELSHLIFGVTGIDKINDSYINVLPEEDKNVEFFCNRFAGAFLVPDDDFDKQTRSIAYTDANISKLAKRYSVSREVILRKLFDKGLVSEDKYIEKATEWNEEYKANVGNGGGGNYYNTKIAYLGTNYMNLVFSNYYQNKITITQAADYLNVKEKSVPSLEEAFLRRGI